MIHKVLQKQLESLGIDSQAGPQSTEKWQMFLTKISNVYSDNDQHRYLINRSLEISSREMQSRWQALKLLEEQWRSLGECSPDLIMMVDLNGIITFANRSKKLFPRESLVGKNILTLYPPGLRDCLQNVLESAKSERLMKCEEVHEEAEQDEHWYSIRINPVLKQGMIVGIVVVETEITEVRKIAIETWIEALNSYCHSTI